MLLNYSRTNCELGANYLVDEVLLALPIRNMDVTCAWMIESIGEPGKAAESNWHAKAYVGLEC